MNANTEPRFQKTYTVVSPNMISSTSKHERRRFHWDPLMRNNSGRIRSARRGTGIPVRINPLHLISSQSIPPSPCNQSEAIDRITGDNPRNRCSNFFRICKRKCCSSNPDSGFGSRVDTSALRGCAHSCCSEGRSVL